VSAVEGVPLAARVDALETTVTELQRELAELKARLDR
jgi:uncharacterized protein YceH (UPF0502 family)